MSNILEQANKIINERSEEKERQYGPMGEGFERAAMIASGMSGKEWSAHDMYIAMVSLKFSRQSYNFKEDNLLDACAYIGAWQNYIDDTKSVQASPDTGATALRDTLNTSKEPEEAKLDAPVASNPYITTHPRDILNALIQLGDKNEDS